MSVGDVGQSVCSREHAGGPPHPVLRLPKLVQPMYLAHGDCSLLDWRRGALLLRKRSKCGAESGTLCRPEGSVKDSSLPALIRMDLPFW